MDKEKILESSRKENKNRDLVELEVAARAGHIAGRVGAAVCVVQQHKQGGTCRVLRIFYTKLYKLALFFFRERRAFLRFIIRQNDLLHRRSDIQIFARQIEYASEKLR